MPQPPAPLDPEKLKSYAKLVFGALGGAMTSAMIYLGDRLGLYRALAGGPPVTSAELAGKTGLSERWLREWLHAQGAAGVLVHHGEGRFGLSTEGEAVLANENHPAFGAGFFSQLPQLVGVAERLPEAFQTGIGLPYDAFGPEGARGVERGLAPWFRALLVPFVLPRVGDVVARLRAGAAAADVGCGGGVALLEMAKAFPGSQFHGYDISQHALARAEENRRAAGVSNASFHDAARDPLPGDARFAFVTSFDCLHDMTDPASVMRRIRGALAPDGTWLIADIKAHGSYQENVEKNPMAAMMYGTSVISCMSSALSEPGGLGLGTLGFPEELARKMTREAGFTRFEPLDLGHPVNAFYLVRP
ncbi:MAG TPA: class I SAM-dependent methyltransferase [Myxococcota bacterium]|jgi:2-polyprenyl-3-methyl-5-hydroxy-6-metoxy-1,4-benzoquinol methylase